MLKKTTPGDGKLEITIHILAGPQADEVHRFQACPISIGRGDGNTLVLRDPSVSDRHGQLFVENGRLHYAHISRTNDAVVETKSTPSGAGRTVRLCSLGEQATLYEGDTISMGDTRVAIDYHTRGGPPPTIPKRAE